MNTPYVYIPINENGPDSEPYIDHYEVGFYDNENNWFLEKVAQNSEAASARVSYLNGHNMKTKIITLLVPCLKRDPTLQKVIDAIEELDIWT